VTLDLDPYQAAAVASTALRTRTRAGAGSGKTRVLTGRAAALIQIGVPSHRIAAITFSKRAADELKDRLGAVAADAWVGTIHSLGYSILRLERPGRDVAGDYKRWIKRALFETKTRWPLREAAREISKAKMTGLHPWWVEVSPNVDRAAKRYQELLDTNPGWNGKPGTPLWDFDDMLMVAEQVLREEPLAKKRWQRWTHILVDEVQDNSPMQWDLVTHLTTPDTNLFVVGDCAQSIYSFRGADPELMLDRLDKRLGPFTDFPLPRNYRSTSSVVTLANSVVEGRKGALRLEATRPGSDADSSIERLPLTAQRIDEARLIADRFQTLFGVDGLKWSDMACLVRTNAQSEGVEAACLEAQIPCVVVGGKGFYARHEVKDVLAYLQLSVGPSASALERIFNKPNRYLGEAFVRELERQGGWDAAARGRAMTFSKRFMNEGYSALRSAVLTLQKSRQGGAQPAALARYVLDSIGYKRWLIDETATEDPDESQIDNVEALVAAASRWDRVEAFLEFAALCQKTVRAGSKGRVQISTIHKSKGLEWPIVAVAGITAGTLPHRRGDEEEERRILYVAVTRARDQLFLAAHGVPSIYWEETLNHVGVGPKLVGELPAAQHEEEDDTPMRDIA
jgi:DNA helicase-2/ATP-dependent DNA helicase PcrA